MVKFHTSHQQQTFVKKTDEKCSFFSNFLFQQKDFFSKMVVDAVLMLDELLPLNMIGIKKVQGGSLEDSVLVITSYLKSIHK